MLDRHSVRALIVGGLAVSAFIAFAITIPALITLSGICASCTVLGTYCCISDHRTLRCARRRRVRPIGRRGRAA